MKIILKAFLVLTLILSQNIHNAWTKDKEVIKGKKNSVKKSKTKKKSAKKKPTKKVKTNAAKAAKSKVATKSTLSKILSSNWTWAAAAGVGVAASLGGSGGGSGGSTTSSEYENQYGLRTLNANEAYQYLEANGLNVAGQGVSVLVVDGNVDQNHSDLGANVTSVTGSDAEEHGTHVAGTIAALKNGVGIHGVAYNATIESVEGYSLTAVQSAIPSAPSTTKIVNASWGPYYGANTGAGNTLEPDLDATQPLSYYTTNHPYLNVEEWYNFLSDKDVLIVNAAGNNAQYSQNGYNPSDVVNPEPMSLFAGRSEFDSKILAVIAVDANNLKSSFSNPAGIAATHAISAPGEDIISNAGYSKFSNYIEIPYQINGDGSLSLNIDDGVVLPSSNYVYTDKCISFSGDQYCLQYERFGVGEVSHYLVISKETSPGSGVYEYNFSLGDAEKESLWNQSFLDFDNKGYYVMSGTSMAAPHVSGAAAVLEGAWNFLSAKQISEILRASATSAYKTTSGGVTFDVAQADSSDFVTNCGLSSNTYIIALTTKTLSCTYGTGIVNLYEAVQAYGDKEITTSSLAASIGAGSKYKADETYLSMARNMSNFSEANLAPLRDAVFFDYFGRDYKIFPEGVEVSNALASSILEDNLYQSNYVPLEFGAGKVKMSLNLKKLNSSEQKINFDQQEVQDKGPRFKFAFNRSENDINKNSLNFGFAINDPFYFSAQSSAQKNYFSHSLLGKESADVYGGAINQTSQFSDELIQNYIASTTKRLNKNFSFFAQFSNFYNPKFYSFDKSESQIQTLGFALNSKDHLKNFSLSFANANEKDGQFLGHQSSGAFNLGDENQTNYISLKYNQKFAKNYNLLLNYSEGSSTLEGDAFGLFREFSNLKSRSYSAGIIHEDFLKGHLGLVYSSPLQYYSGKVRIDYATGRDLENIHRESAWLDLSDQKKKHDIELFWNKKLGKKQNSLIQANLAMRNQEFEDENILFLQYRTAF